MDLLRSGPAYGCVGRGIRGEKHERDAENYVCFKRAYEDKSQNPMWACIHEYFVEKYSDLAKEKPGVDTLDTQTRFSVRLYCYGTLGMTREWLLNDNITPAQTVVQTMFNSMPALLRKACFGE